MKQTIGVLGCGYVGNAVLEAFKTYFNIYTYDILPEKRTISSLKELSEKCRFIFSALPTPVNKDGSCYLSIIEEVLKEIDQYNNNNIIIIKSSVPPGTTKSFAEKYKNIHLVFNPEFLTERNANKDFANQESVILGGHPDITNQVKEIFNIALPSATVYETNFTTAEMTKFFVNCFFATKVSFCNEMYQICEATDTSYDEMIKLALLDKRIEEDHTMVPGWDGMPGFSLSCLPNNCQILIDVAIKLGVDPKVIKGVWEKNLEVRPGKDWENLKGRTIL